MSCRYRLLTNNPRYKSAQYAALPVEYMDTTGMGVIIAGRDLIHMGWVLLNHPLYGNFRPYQQPFRTLLLREHQPSDDAVDQYSLDLISNGLNVYQNCDRPHLTPQTTPPRMLDDCATIDFELMQETLLKAGLIR